MNITTINLAIYKLNIQRRNARKNDNFVDLMVDFVKVNLSPKDYLKKASPVKKHIYTMIPVAHVLKFQCFTCSQQLQVFDPFGALNTLSF